MDLRSDNDDTLQRIESSANLTEIKEIAVNQLGMSYPDGLQVVYYSVDETDAMTQYAEVP